MNKPPDLEQLLASRSTLLELKLLICSRAIEGILRKYRPDQPRVPAGRPEGGQWTTDPDTGTIRTAGKWDLRREGECNEQLRLDEEICRASRSPTCWSLTQTRWAACMKNDFIPKLRH